MAFEEHFDQTKKAQQFVYEKKNPATAAAVIWNITVKEFLLETFQDFEGENSISSQFYCAKSSQFSKLIWNSICAEINQQTIYRQFTIYFEECAKNKKSCKVKEIQNAR